MKPRSSANHFLATQNIYPQVFLLFITMLVSVLTLSAPTASASDELLDVDQAFVLKEPVVVDNKITIEWDIATDYKLYKDKMSVEAKNIEISAPSFSKAKLVDDPLFGKTEVFADKASLTISYSNAESDSAELVIGYQGCADKIGVCYPPQTRTLKVALPSASSNSTPLAASSGTSFGSLSALDKFLKQDSAQAELLEADEAFQFSHEVTDDGKLQLNWIVAPDYHLYQDKIKTKVISGDATLGSLQLPPSTMIDDVVFGKTAVFHGAFSAQLPIQSIQGEASIEVEYQGCSATSGVCYPPARKQIAINQSEITPSSASSFASSIGSNVTSETTDRMDLSETDRITDTLKNSSVWIVILTFFVFGLLLSLTPCVFPMIPILSSIIAGQGDKITTRKAFTMALVYVLAMSITYTAAGVLAGIFGENLQAAFQNPWIIGSFSIIFLLLALSMFGFYELQLPASVQSKLTHLSNKQEGGTYTGVAIMGFLSALIVGPCVAPPLAGALIYIGQTGDALLGGTALFAMSMGMGVPLLLLGASAGKLLPRAGAWMDSVKAVFGVMLIAVAIWMASRILPAEITMLAWALLFITSAVYLGAFANTAEKSGWFKLAKGLGIALFLYGAALFIGLMAGSNNVLQPLKVFQGGGTGAGQAVTEKLDFKIIKSYQDLQAELAKGQPVMFDFYADWCVSCKEMEAFTFSDSKVQSALKGVTLLKADVTANDDIDKALMKQFGIIGPPAILFFNEQGEEQKAQRVVGFKNAEEFTAIINKAYGK